MTDMSQLAPLVGRWSTTITMLAPAEAKGDVHHAIDTYRWLAGNTFLVHDVEGRMGDEPMTSMEVYSDSGIVSRNFGSHGEISDYRAAMSDGVWTLESETERLTSKLTSPDTVEGLWRRKEAGGWIDWMTVRLVRVA